MVCWVSTHTHSTNSLHMDQQCHPQGTSDASCAHAHHVLCFNALHSSLLDHPRLPNAYPKEYPVLCKCFKVIKANARHPMARHTKCPLPTQAPHKPQQTQSSQFTTPGTAMHSNQSTKACLAQQTTPTGVPYSLACKCYRLNCNGYSPGHRVRPYL